MHISCGYYASYITISGQPILLSKEYRSFQCALTKDARLLYWTMEVVVNPTIEFLALSFTIARFYPVESNKRFFCGQRGIVSLVMQRAQSFDFDSFSPWSFFPIWPFFLMEETLPSFANWREPVDTALPINFPSPILPPTDPFVTHSTIFIAIYSSILQDLSPSSIPETEAH